MGLLIYSNGMDVRVATVESADLHEIMPGRVVKGSMVQWEHCNEEAKTRNINMELRAQLASAGVFNKQLSAENDALVAKLNKVYGVLGE